MTKIPGLDLKNMKLAVISDIHGNLEALTAVIERIETCSVDQIISLGDNIGYGPNPNEVMDLLARNKIQSILGNHEMVVKSPRFITWFNPVAQKSVIKTHATLLPHHIKTIHTFKEHMIKENLRFVHGVPPHSPFLYPFQLSDKALARKILELAQPICFCGHTHELELIECTCHGELTRHPLDRGAQTLKKDSRYLINAGSVGQPRDANKDAKVVLYDSLTHTMEVLYVPYPYPVTMQKIRDAGLPESFATKLSPN